jgi:hypothetical protein
VQGAKPPAGARGVPENLLSPDMGVQGAKPPAGARGVPASFPFPKRCIHSALMNVIDRAVTGDLLQVKLASRLLEGLT